MARKKSPSRKTAGAGTRSAKKTSGRKISARKASARKTSRPRKTVAALKREARSGTLDEWLDGVREFASTAVTTDDNPRGACLVPDPAGGPAMCLVTDRKTCKEVLKGRFVGGSC